jgi:ATP-dependent DNA helicase RecG
LKLSFLITCGITSGKEIAKPILTLQLLVIKPEFTAEEIGSIIGVSERSVQDHLKKLREYNFIQRIGGRKEGYWEILKH